MGKGGRRVVGEVVEGAQGAHAVEGEDGGDEEQDGAVWLHDRWTIPQDFLSGHESFGISMGI